MYQRQTSRKTMASLASMVALTVLAAPMARAQYGGGSGTADDPYLIYTPAQMNAIGLHQDHWSKHFKLMADLDLSVYTDETFNLIGYYSPLNRGGDSRGFRGVFDGNGHTIAHFTYLVDANEPPIATGGGFQSSRETAFGLFRLLWSPGQIKNLGLIDPLIEPTPDATEWVSSVGALVGRNAGAITDCHVKGGQVAGHGFVGGLVGYNHSVGKITDCHASCKVAYATDGSLRESAAQIPTCFGGLVGFSEGEIRNCHASGSVQSVTGVGGLVGRNDALNRVGRIANCFATSSVSGTNSVGGLVGDNVGHIRSSYATGKVSGDTDVGGLVGSISDVTRYYGKDRANAIPKVEHCYAAGAVSGNDFVGGLAGIQGIKSVVSGCFWDRDTSGQQNSPGGGACRTTTQMQEKAIYLDAGWDFLGESDNGTEETWTMDGDAPGYPKLAWERADDVAVSAGQKTRPTP